MQTCKLTELLTGGETRVETINEGSLLVDTTEGLPGEGPIHTGSVKATRAVLTTNGIALLLPLSEFMLIAHRGTTLAMADLIALFCCHTLTSFVAGALVNARKLTSEVATLASEGGPVTVQHLIAKTAVIDSSRHTSQGQGGPVSITTAYTTSLQVSSGTA